MVPPVLLRLRRKISPPFGTLILQEIRITELAGNPYPSCICAVALPKVHADKLSQRSLPGTANIHLSDSRLVALCSRLLNVRNIKEW